MNVAVVGATGAVGETILRVLEEREIPIESLEPFASRARGGAVRFRGCTLDVHAASQDALRGFDVVFFAGGEDASEQFAPALVENGSVVIDNSATFRMREDVPLIVPGVNSGALRAEHRLFPVANCTAIVLCSALRPIRDVAGLRSIHVATYQAASGAGRAGLDELLAGERAVVGDEVEPAPAVFARPLARNVVPQVGTFDDAGWSGEELKICDETRKMLDLPELEIAATAVRVPVRTAHSAAVFCKTERATSVDALASAFGAAPGIVFHRAGIVTPREVEGTNEVHVARLRSSFETRSFETRAARAPQDDTRAPQDDTGAPQDDTSNVARDFALWCVGDQLRRGAATNAVEILELLLDKGYLSA